MIVSPPHTKSIEKGTITKLYHFKMPVGEKKTIERNQHWYTLGTGMPSTKVQSNPFTL
jgi:hypothetical protein